MQNKSTYKRFAYTLRPILAGVLMAVLLGVLMGGGGAAGFAIERPIFKNVSLDEAEKLIAENGENTNFVVLDVRMESEFLAGHLAGAVNIDYYSESFRDELNRLDRDETYFVYCKSGNRSSRSMQIMSELGFQEVYSLSGGYAQMETRGFPVVK